MDEYWSAFIGGFCKVEFLCHTGDPNWLGWGVIGIGVLIVGGIVTTITNN